MEMVDRCLPGVPALHTEFDLQNGLRKAVAGGNRELDTILAAQQVELDSLRASLAALTVTFKSFVQQQQAAQAEMRTKIHSSVAALQRVSQMSVVARSANT